MKLPNVVALAFAAAAVVLGFAPASAQPDGPPPAPAQAEPAEQPRGTSAPAPGEPTMGGAPPAAGQAAPPGAVPVGAARIPVTGLVLLGLAVGVGILALWPAWMAAAPSPQHRAARRLALSTMSLALLAPLIAILFEVDSASESFTAYLVVCAGGATLSYVAPDRRLRKAIPIVCAAVAMLFATYIAMVHTQVFPRVRSQHQSAFMAVNVVVPFAIAAMLLAMIVTVVRVRPVVLPGSTLAAE